MGDKYARRRAHPNSIVRLRGRADLSIDQLAKKIKLDLSTVRDLETGKLKLHAGHLSLLSKAFKCEPDEILMPCVSRRNPQIAIRHSKQNLEKGRGANRWAGRLKIPKHAHPLVRELFKLLNDRELMINDVAKPSGIARNTISEWRYRRLPSVASLEAVLNAFGFELKIVKKEDVDDLS
jgi:transcriptional regulator with XRE-family HTH domain